MVVLTPRLFNKGFKVSKKGICMPLRSGLEQQG